MHMFDETQKLHKYDNIYEIINHFIHVRKQIYSKRKDYMLKSLTYEANVLTNKAKFILEILNETLDLRKKKSCEVTKILNDKGYTIINDDMSFKYLVRMPMDSVTEENVEKLSNQYNDKLRELEILKETTTEQMWMKELDDLYVEYTRHREQLQASISGVDNKKKVTKKKIILKKKTV